MVNMENYEEYMLLYADGELTEAEEKELLAFVAQHPQLEEELKAYAATKAMPDAQMVYEGKEALLKSEKRTIAFDRRWIYTAAAACVAMILFFVFNNKENNNEPVVAQHTTETKTTNDQRPVQPADTEELHSTPVDPISVKHAATQQPVLVAKNHNTVKTTAEVKQKQQETVIAKKQEQLPVANENTQPIVTPQNKTKEEQLPILVNNEQQPKSNNNTPAQREKDNSLLDIIDRDRFEGAKMIAQAFDDKVEKVKNIKKQLKDTDVALKIGKREFLIVRL